jgi:hypothetical protein
MFDENSEFKDNRQDATNLNASHITKLIILLFL